MRRTREACREEDLGAVLADLGRIVERGSVDDELAAGILSTALNHGEDAALARVYDAITSFVKPEHARRGHVAYNAACAAARLGRKNDMLTWLRAGKLAGDHPRDALLDPDCARFHDDPDLRALAEEP
jgi:hypothetical protein